MSSTWQYNPVAAAQANGTWDTTFLSDRDVSAQVPINFVPHPGVYVTAACFANQLYEVEDLAICLSNLLSSQFRRFVIDVYWDPRIRTFSLCPVQSSDASPAAASSAASILSTATSSSPSSNTTSSSSAPDATTRPAQLRRVTSATSGKDVRQVGKYQCSESLTLATIASVFEDYLTLTSTDLEAKIVMWTIDLHVAADGSNNQSTLSESQLPNSTETIHSYLSSVDDFLYTPVHLETDRSDLNASWYRRSRNNEVPLLQYMTVESLSNGILRTPNGWPNENYVQFGKQKRMLVGYGFIDEAIAGYATHHDADYIFPPEYLLTARSVTFEPDGRITNGCFYNATEFTVNQVNNSWAAATINANNPSNIGLAADNLTTCGISQLLNVTIDSKVANDDPEPYQIFGNQAIFSWAYGEPKNDSSSGIKNDDKFRCALMVSNDTFSGHWRVDYCGTKYRTACREAQSPYRWTLSEYSVPYDDGDAACTGNTTFGLPRTGLELTYLYNEIMAESKQDSSLLNGVWINFNSLDYEGCWVTTGPNGTCPYGDDASATESRQILIPALAALIVLILTGLTILVKCSANVRQSRVRKRGEGGWDYEGIPS